MRGHAILLTILSCLALAAPARAQGIEVSPVNINLAPGERAAALTIANKSERAIAFQIRAFLWRQSASGEEVLTRTDDLLVSPPLSTIAPGAAQTVRLVLRRPPQAREASYRILFDELAPPSEPGAIHIVVRLSIPVFAQPEARIASRLSWRIASRGGDTWLLVRNDGTAHESISDIALRTSDGRTFGVAAKGPPYVLADGEHGWQIVTQGRPPAPGTALRLTAKAVQGAIDQEIRVDAAP